MVGKFLGKHSLDREGDGKITLRWILIGRMGGGWNWLGIVSNGWLR